MKFLFTESVSPSETFEAKTILFFLPPTIFSIFLLQWLRWNQVRAFFVLSDGLDIVSP